MDVVCCLIIQKEKVLLAQRPLQKAHGGYWEFPGGKKENNEQLDEALVRELYEELKINVLGSHLNYIGAIKEETITLHFYSYQLAGHYSPQEHRAVHWSPFGDLKLYKLCPTDSKGLQHYKAAMRKLVENS